MLGQGGGSTLAKVIAQRFRKVSRKQKSRDESRLAQKDRIKSRNGSQRRLLVVARRNVGPVGRHARKLFRAAGQPGRIAFG